VGLRDGLDRCGKSLPTGIRSPDRPTRRQSLYRLRYSAHKDLQFHNESFVFSPRTNIDLRLTKEAAHLNISLIVGL
jgi:hypothetical protein